MSETPLDRLVDRFLGHRTHFHPVDGTFMGLPGGDHSLPAVGMDAVDRERAELDELIRLADQCVVGPGQGQRLDARMLKATLAHARASLDHWPRFRQPSWYTGEAAFGLISLLLPTAPDGARDALRQRIEAVPAFLDAGSAALADQSTPPDWSRRAQRECAAAIRLLTEGLRLHPFWAEDLDQPALRAAGAFDSFSQSLDGLPPRDAACGRDYLAFLMRDVHALPWSPDEAVALASDAFARLGKEIASHPAATAPAGPTISPQDLPGEYGRWHQRALRDGSALVTPATEYGLAFQPLPAWAAGIAGDLYFLSYRSPPALAPGAGSIYWTAPIPQPEVAIKQTHAVHHGSIGHHTQNARARSAMSRLARIAGTDCASGIAFLSAGTMVEGWSSYSTELIAEAPGFYSPSDELAVLQAERRNAASVLADIRLHTGEWSLDQMRVFYRDEAGFPEARIWGETTRNSILPATRLMYFLGTEQIKALRREIGGPPRALFDDLLSCGHVPLAWAADEVRRLRGAQEESAATSAPK